MKIIVEVIKRLYLSGKLTKEDLALRVKKMTITLDDYNDIINNGETK